MTQQMETAAPYTFSSPKLGSQLLLLVVMVVVQSVAVFILGETQ